MRSVALALALGCVSPLCVSGQTARDFQGAWDLVRTESPNDSGEWVTTTEPFGPDAHGIIMYDGVGSMSVYIVRQGNAASRGDLAYYGRYEVDAVQRIVTHKREHSTSGDPAVDAVRGFEFDGELLILTVEPARQLRVVWRKRP
jgi:hypothetical protein